MTALFLFLDGAGWETEEADEILKRSDNNTGNRCQHSNPLKFRDFVLQKNNRQCYGRDR